MNTTELQTKIDEYRKEIVAMEAENAELANSGDVFDRIAIVENNSKIRDYSERIARLERQINGTPEPGVPTARQVELSTWATSPEYDEL
jgi:uncharacterized coiled-coil DUF342 family protein